MQHSELDRKAQKKKAANVPFVEVVDDWSLNFTMFWPLLTSAPDVATTGKFRWRAEAYF